jgi:ammonia channel protein AmtB
MTFAIITPALIVGGFAVRFRHAAVQHSLVILFTHLCATGWGG